MNISLRGKERFVIKTDTQALKVRVGRGPFDARLKFADDFTACPFHGGESPTSMHLEQKDDGAWLATCFSKCKKSWDAIAFVMEFDKCLFPEALKKLGEVAATAPPPEPVQPKPKSPPMTAEKWAKWGRPLEPKDIERFAASRKDKTASFETYAALGCRVKGDYIGFPYRVREKFLVVKMRHLDRKDFLTENNLSMKGLFNIDAVNPLEDVYVVEGEPDVAVMVEAGFCAVSPTTGAQHKYESEVITLLSEAPRIFVVGDQKAGADAADPGQECMEILQKLLPPEKTFRITFSEAHDVSQLAKQLGPVAFEQRINELRDDAMTPWVLRGSVPRIHELPKDPQKWIIDRLLPYGGLALLSGTQGAQKSLFAMKAAHCVVSKQDFLGRPVLSEKKRLGAPVLYLDRENPAPEVNKRRERLGIIGSRDFFYWGDWSRDPVPEPDDRRLEEFAAAGGYIIFDSFQQWAAGENENDTGAMVTLMNKFKRLARLGAGVLVLHHNNKADRKTGKSQFRGSTAIVACSDMAIKATKTESETIELRAERFRLCAPWEIDFKVHFDEHPENLQGTYYAFELLRDDGPADAIKHREQEKYQKEDPDRKRLVEYVRVNPSHSPRKMESDLSMSRKKLIRLLDEKGWKWNGSQWLSDTPDEIGMLV